MVSHRIIHLAYKRKGLSHIPLFSVKENPLAARLRGARSVCLTPSTISHGFKWPANAELKAKMRESNGLLFE